ncbi:IniB N-terminal domain-containing protein [Pseudonocardia alaniniphila]|uniref:IniB N-terminal domain-containing protein n=2 Tax=Pseudonocardia alaniniphila TaxID=75291 RepID=A0ABS9T711_9PSEU|nr:IniB N-terminal domain-containing protein [Pseudonocardia alaniniphila]
MAQPMTLLEFLRELTMNEQARDLYAANPEATLSQYGLDNLSPADVRDALVLIEDNETAQYTAGHFDAQFGTPPPVPMSYAGSEHEAAVEYINRYVSNDYDSDRDANGDNFLDQNVRNSGIFDQDVDVDALGASGDGSVAAGDGITDSAVVSGDENQVGAGNLSGDNNVVGNGNAAVGGDGNTIAFGDGDANKSALEDVGISHGGALSVGATATGDYDANGSFNDVDASTRNSTEFDDSFNTDNDSANDSFNEFSTDNNIDSHDHTHNDNQSHNNLDIDS